MNEDFDIILLAKLLDTAMTSKDQTVKTSFQKLMMVVALVEDNETTMGPIRSLINRVDVLENKLHNLTYPQPLYSQQLMSNTGKYWTGTSISSQNNGVNPYGF